MTAEKKFFDHYFWLSGPIPAKLREGNPAGQQFGNRQIRLKAMPKIAPSNKGGVFGVGVAGSGL